MNGIIGTVFMLLLATAVVPPPLAAAGKWSRRQARLASCPRNRTLARTDTKTCPRNETPARDHDAACVLLQPERASRVQAVRAVSATFAVVAQADYPAAQSAR